MSDFSETAGVEPAKRKRNRITREHLKSVAEVYRQADTEGAPPTRAVQQAFDTTHSTAAKWVGQARKEGVLRSPGSRGGEQVHPTALAAADAKGAFAGWLREARVVARLSQRELAEAVAPQGFHWLQSKIAKIEGGELIPRLDEAVALTNVFGTTLDVALGLTPGSPDSLASRRAASQLVLLQQIRASIDAELGGAS